MDISREQLNELYVKQHLTNDQIAEKLKCHSRTINKYLNKYGLKCPLLRKAPKDIPTSQLLALVKENKSVIQMGEIFQCCASTIYKALELNNISLFRKKRTKRNKLLPTKKLLTELYIKKNMTAKEIANEYNTSIDIIRNLAKEYELHKQTRGELTKGLLQELYVTQKLYPSQIAGKLKLTHQAVLYALKKYGLWKPPVKESILTEAILTELYIKKNMTAKEIANEVARVYGKIYTVASIYNCLGKYQLKRLKSDTNAFINGFHIEESVLRKYYLEENLTQKQVAEKLNCTFSTVRRYVQEYNLHKHSPYYFSDIYICKEGYVWLKIKSLSNEQKKWAKKISKNTCVVQEHRLVMCMYLQRVLATTEIVHHINGNKQDNRIENLEIYSRSTHVKVIPKLQKRIRELEQRLARQSA